MVLLLRQGEVTEDPTVFDEELVTFVPTPSERGLNSGCGMHAAIV